jgi:hypothetical protein
VKRICKEGEKKVRRRWEDGKKMVEKRVRRR